MNKYGPNEGNIGSSNRGCSFGGAGDNASTSGWTEIDLSEVMKRPCFAYKRGNIVFTSIPPSRDEKRARSAQLSTADNGGDSGVGRCGVKITTTECEGDPATTATGNGNDAHPHPRADFCEVCCGIRSPSFSRRAHSFTTHFCTRVPAKGSNVVSTLSPFMGPPRAVASNPASSVVVNGTNGSSNSSLASSYRSPPKSQGHVSRLSTFLQAQRNVAAKKGEPEQQQPVDGGSDRVDGSFALSTSSGVTSGHVSEASSSRSKEQHQAPPSSTSNGGGGCTNCTRSSTRTTLDDDLYSSYSSSYPSSCSSSYLPFFLDRSFSAKSGFSSSANCSSCLASSSFENFYISDQCSTSSSFTYKKDPENELEAANDAGVKGTSTMMGGGARRGVRYLRNVFSSTDNSTSDEESDDETCTSSSEMGWSFGSFWEVENGTIKKASCPATCGIATGGEKLQKSASSTRTITPFESNANRTMDVLEKFGTIVGSFRKPGHHVGPSKNADCLCDNCKSFFAKK